MKNKKQFTLIELIIVIVVIGTLVAMALPKFNGVVRNAKLSAMINDKEVLEKTLIMYYQNNDELPLLNEAEELIIANEGISLSKIVLAEEATSNDMETIYTSLKETLTYHSDSDNSLYRIDLSKIKDNLSKDIKYGHKKHDKDFYVYSVKTGNVYYYDYLINGNGTIQHTEYDTLLKDNELVKKTISPLLNSNKPINEDNISFKNSNIVLGESHSMKIGIDGNLYVWGRNNYGQLGLENVSNKYTPQLLTLPNEEKPITISTGQNHSMVITDKGNLYSWGYNNDGQLGIGNKINKYIPQKVILPNGETPTSISLGTFHSMVITNKGNLYSWGDNYYGQLGIGGISTKLTPQLVELPNKEKAISISLGSQHSIILTEGGNLYSCGRNNNGQLGIGNTMNQSTPQLITLPNKEKTKYIYSGGHHSMIITESGKNYIWGWNNDGQLGIGNIKDQSTPQLITLTNEEKVSSISLGYRHSLVITDEGNIYSWGYNNVGQLGLGDKINYSTPQHVELPNEEKPIYVSSGLYNSIIFTNKGNFYSCGDNSYGQLLTGNTTNNLYFVKSNLP